jgi:hypothetical protein
MGRTPMATFLNGLELFKEKNLAEKLAAQNLPTIRGLCHCVPAMEKLFNDNLQLKSGFD